MDDNLPGLRDIHLPEGVSVFPPAYGWLVILAAILAAYLLYTLFRLIRRKSKRLFALRLLDNTQTGNPILDALRISEILRRICIYKYRDAAGLFGDAWLAFLYAHTKSTLTEKPAELLLNGPYISEKSKEYSAKDVEALRDFCKNWIKENL